MTSNKKVATKPLKLKISMAGAERRIAPTIGVIEVNTGATTGKIGG
jgi:hypothetical protein